MKERDWNETRGHRIPVLAHCFNLERGVSADVRLRAGTLAEAWDKVLTKLQCRKDFLRETADTGFTVQWRRLESQ